MPAVRRPLWSRSRSPLFADGAAIRTVALLALVTLSSGVFPRGAPLAAQSPPAELRVLEDTTSVQRIVLRDGTKLLGRILTIDGDLVTFRTMGGLEITFERRDVRQIREVRGERRGDEFWPRDPSDNRLFLGPTARVAEHGHGYVGVYELFFPSFGVGVGGVAMISGGMSLLPHLAFEEQLFYLSGKFQVFDVEHVQGAAGVFWTKPGTTEESAGLVFGTVTAGKTTGAITAGIAFPFTSHDGFAEDPLIFLGGEARVTRRLKLVAESWTAPAESATVLALGVRILAERLTVEVAAAGSTDDGPIVPVVNFSVAW